VSAPVAGRAKCLIAVTAVASLLVAGCGRPPDAPTTSAPPGSDSLEVAALAARSLFAKAKACPLDRVTATAHPPPLLAAPRDPEQARVPQLPIVAEVRFMTVEGCGATAVYACMTRGGPGEVTS
jgi:hypothetical protein